MGPPLPSLTPSGKGCHNCVGEAVGEEEGQPFRSAWTLSPIHPSRAEQATDTDLQWDAQEQKVSESALTMCEDLESYLLEGTSLHPASTL